MDLLWTAFSPAYMQRALIEIILLAIAGSAVGVFVVLKRLAFFTEAMQHTVFPGIVIAFMLQQSLLWGAFAAAACTVLLFTVLSRRARVDADALLGLLLSSFFAVGVVLVSRGNGYQHDLTTLLFGRILTIDQRQLIETVVIVTVVVVAIAVLYKELLVAAFDPHGAEAMGYRISVLELILNALVALVVVAAVQAVGTVLVLAFIVTPAATAHMLGFGVKALFVVAAAVAMVCGWVGLLVSYQLSISHGVNVASGAAIVVAATLAFVVAAGFSVVRRRGQAA